MDTAPPLLSVVIPTRNEHGNVDELDRRLRDALVGISYELCFVDDSDDGTEQLISALGAHARCIHRLGTERRGGLSTAVVAGLQMAEGLYVCVMDADLQHPPSVIPRMLAAAQGGADLVVGSRYVHGGSHRGLGRGSRVVASQTARAAAQLIFAEARRTHDPLSGFFLCRRSLVQGILFRPVGFKILLELLVCLPGIRVTDVPIEFAERTSGASKASPEQGRVFAQHLLSLTLHVRGSARGLKSGVVGAVGLAVLVSTMSLALREGAPAPLSFAIVFPITVAVNAVLNAKWTFADMVRPPIRRYLISGGAAGIIAFAIFLALVSQSIWPIPSALVAAALAGALRAVFDRRQLRRARPAWIDSTIRESVRASLDGLQRAILSDSVDIVPPTADQFADPDTGEVVRRVFSRRLPVLFVEAASHRPQRRTNLEMTSHMGLPIVSGGEVLAVVVLTRRSTRGFSAADLALASRMTEWLDLAALTAGELAQSGGGDAPWRVPPPQDAPSTLARPTRSDQTV